MLWFSSHTEPACVVLRARDPSGKVGFRALPPKTVFLLLVSTSRAEVPCLTRTPLPSWSLKTLILSDWCVAPAPRRWASVAVNVAGGDGGAVPTGTVDLYWITRDGGLMLLLSQLLSKNSV